MKLTVETPEGDYREDCKFMEHYDYPLVDMFGNETGNRRSGYKCRYFNSDLEVEDFGCYQKIKKCFMCNGQLTTDDWWILYWLIYFSNGDKEMLKIFREKRDDE